MTGVSWVTQADRERWQRQAVSELASILDAHPGLPLIAWTVGPAGGGLAGQVTGPGPAGQARAVFSAWRAALGLEDHREHASGGGTVFLHAAACRGRVRVRLTATIFDDGHDDEAVTS